MWSFVLNENTLNVSLKLESNIQRVPSISKAKAIFFLNMRSFVETHHLKPGDVTSTYKKNLQCLGTEKSIQKKHWLHFLLVFITDY